MKNNYPKIFIYLGLFLISLFTFPSISEAADVAASASRTSGVAPLSVHFNADLTASSPTERSFHDLEYSWDFGDTNAGTWGTDNKPKNEDKGPVAAHVYETPGTFTTTLTVRNATGIIDTKTFEITVDDPDVVFAGSKTTYISDMAHNDVDGCPDGATYVKTDNISLVGDYLGTGKRVLLHRGSSWNYTTRLVTPSGGSPCTLGAYGACASPNSQGICSNAPLIEAAVDDNFLNISYKNDWRIMDISFVGDKTIDEVMTGATSMKSLTVLRLKITGFYLPIGLESWRTSDSSFADNITVASSLIQDVGLHTMYIGGEHLALMGNDLKNSDASHLSRIAQANPGVISHNRLSGANLANTNGRHALKLHGPQHEEIGDYATTGSGGFRKGTGFVVISNNVFGGSGPWPISIGPQNAESDERVADVIYEKNKTIAMYGNQNNIPKTGIMFEARYVTVRNNVFDGTGAEEGWDGIVIARRGIEPTPLGIRIYNNTIYSNNNGGESREGISVTSSAADTIIRNNYVSFPGMSGEVLISDNSENAILSNNIMTDTPYFTDSDNINPLLRNFSLTSSSTEAIDQGTTILVFDDFTGQSRSSAYDIGAYEYFSGGDTTPPSAPTGLGVL